MVYAPRFLPTLGYPRAVALHFVRCDQLTAGLAPAGVRPCWAHIRRQKLIFYEIKDLSSFEKTLVPLIRTKICTSYYDHSSCIMLATGNSAGNFSTNGNGVTGDLLFSRCREVVAE